MQGLPHTYTATASASADSHVTTRFEGQPQLTVAPPANFGGPGDLHSPEDLVAAAVAGCFILSFKAIARASKLDWDSIEITTEGVLDQVDRATQFTEFTTRGRLVLPAGASRDKAQRLLEKAEETCFVTNSLKAGTRLEVSLEGGE